MCDKIIFDPDSIPYFEPPQFHSNGIPMPLIPLNVELKRKVFSPPCRCPAKAEAQNEKYAAIIRSRFSGRDSEMSSLVCFIYQAIKFSVCSEEFCQAIYDIILEKLGHIRVLGELLLSLGGEPKFFCGVSPNAIAGSWWNASPAVIQYPADLGQALQSNISREKESIAEYKSISAYIDDKGVCSALQGIILEKEKHLETFSLLYTRFCS